ncbi:MAG TPA: Holliday junction branch migration protein RuvA [Bacteroidales bacterium]|nr:Holliday junction branch migration protein RuvA [Bacteroidales bacterium]
MYAFISGVLAEKNPTSVVIDCNGVGFQIHITLYSFAKLPEAGMPCRLLIHHIVREDAHLLFGFLDDQERVVFRELITVSGIGANTARLVLSALTPEEVRSAIVSGNWSVLQRVKGIGNKTAQRVIVELKDRLNKTISSGGILNISYNTGKDEALSALVMLGFSRASADKALDRIILEYGADAAVEDLIKNALKVL